MELLQEPDPGFHWVFRVVELFPEPYRICESFRIGIDEEPTAEDINALAWESLPDPSCVAELVFSPVVVSRFGRP